MHLMTAAIIGGASDESLLGELLSVERAESRESVWKGSIYGTKS